MSIAKTSTPESGFPSRYPEVNTENKLNRLRYPPPPEGWFEEAGPSARRRDELETAQFFRRYGGVYYDPSAIIAAHRLGGFSCNTLCWSIVKYRSPDPARSEMSRCYYMICSSLRYTTVVEKLVLCRFGVREAPCVGGTSSYSVVLYHVILRQLH